ncbi:formimidoylglutamase [Robiginitalea sp.]|uniref:formimidoylglutamase n=1 Tax=Robiginitalea sp. TaxID=1902411 RepID=UPI003C757D77
MMHPTYSPPELSIWKGRASTDQAYLHENILPLDLGAPQIQAATSLQPALLGYATDAGVTRNSGRPGAAEGPKALREVFGRMPVLKNGAQTLWDAGNFICPDGQLENTQEGFSRGIARLIQNGYFPLGIGGGHDIAYAHYKGLAAGLERGTRLGVLNLDAHLDLRKPDPLPHSGSPFLQIAAHCAEIGTDFKYCCLGARRDANPQELWDRASSLNVMLIERPELRAATLPDVIQTIQGFLDTLDALYLTIDLDGFASAYAPGVSAPSPMGFTPDTILPILEVLLESKKLKSVDIAELNPAYDRDAQTAVLAAGLFHRILSDRRLF